jgi:hypothetical protein
MEELVLKGQVDAAQIAAWKQSWPLGVFQVVKDGRVGYFKNPDFKELDAYLAVGREGKTSASAEWKTLTGMLWLGGDRELIESPLYLGNVAKKVQEAISGEDAALKKL